MIRRGDDAVVGGNVIRYCTSTGGAGSTSSRRGGGGGGGGGGVAQSNGVTLAQSGHLVQPLLGMCIGQKPNVQKLGVWKLDCRKL